MTEDWQQWYKHKIDAWQASATVQTLTDAGYRAFHNLLMAQFQQPDGKLPESDQELAKYSRRGLDWNRPRRGAPTIAEEVMPHFISDGAGRVFNPTQYKIWQDSLERHRKHVDRTAKANAAKAQKHSHNETLPVPSTGAEQAQNETLTETQRDEVEVDVEVGSKDLKPFALASPAPAAESPSHPKLRLIPEKLEKKCHAIDARFTPFRLAIEAYWKRANTGVEMPWDGGESKRLHDFLKACPSTGLEAFEKMLANRERSDVVQSHRPRAWITSLTDYANGPLDRYGKPAAPAVNPEASVGVQRGTTAARQEKFYSALRTFEAREGREPTAEEWAAEIERSSANRAWADGERPKIIALLESEIEARAKVRASEKEAKEADYQRAIQAARTFGRPSIHAIQRAMKVSYAHGVYWIDRMLADGIAYRTEDGLILFTPEAQPC